MLNITISAVEQYDEARNEFTTSKEQALNLEHSLVSLSKWESKWHKPFLARNEKTIEETIDYIRCMTVTQNVDPSVYRLLPSDAVNKVKAYIDEPMTATTIAYHDNRPSREIITSELIYYWMINFNIPFECQKWHLNRLLTLINVCNIKQQKPKKMGRQATMNYNAQINAARRQQLNNKG